MSPVAAEPRPSYGQLIQDFHDKVREFTLRAACGREYVRVARLQEWLRGTCARSGKPRLTSLLYACPWNPSSQQIRPPIPPDVLKPKGLILLSILIEISQTQYIEHFWRQDIVGSKIPAGLEDLKTKLSAALGPKDKGKADALAEAFYAAQWKYCPVVFHHLDVKQYPREQILPIVRKKPIFENTERKKGGTADLFQIEVLEEFVDIPLRQVVPNSHYDHGEGLGTCYQFALKVFRGANSRHYHSERQAFTNIQDLDGMIKCLNTFQHEDFIPSVDREMRTPERKELDRTYNILLEYGDRDLEAYFAQTNPPFLEPEIFAFWKELFEVVKAVKLIHDYENPDKINNKFYKGWHADIKPENILLVENKCKLADFGFATFVPATEEAMAFLAGATWKYSAPEHLPGKKGKVTQAIDIWSLGCVLSIAATWVVGGNATVRAYGRVREKAIQTVKKQPNNPLAKISKGDFFCDGIGVLDAVTHWHQTLKCTASRADNITAAVLDLIDNCMFKANPEERISCNDLHGALQTILLENPVDPGHRLPESILRALQDIDNEAPQVPVPSLSSTSRHLRIESTGSAQYRRDSKAMILDIPLKKVAFRAEYIASVIGNAPSNAPQARPSPAQRETRQYSLEQDQAHTLPQRPGPVLIRREPPHKALDVFQAYYQLEQNKKAISNPFRRLSASLRPKTIKTEILDKYLHHCNIKFLVDNGWNMLEHWAQATFVLHNLAEIASRYDTNGLDLSFTCAGLRLKGREQGSVLVNSMWKEENLPRQGSETNMTQSLDQVFLEHLQEIRSQDMPKRLLLFVLTNGIWGDSAGRQAVSTKIVDFVRAIAYIVRHTKLRAVGIQFVQLGDDAEGREMLQYLDDCLPKDYQIDDVIDTEPAYGDVNKMFLGPLYKRYDELEHFVSSPTKSPSQVPTVEIVNGDKG